MLPARGVERRALSSCDLTLDMAPLAAALARSVMLRACSPTQQQEIQNSTAHQQGVPVGCNKDCMPMRRQAMATKARLQDAAPRRPTVARAVERDMM